MPQIAEDLFTTKEQALRNWCRQKGFFSKADLMLYGAQNYYLSAWRRVCEWVNEVPPIVAVVEKDECIFRGLRGKMRWYKWIGL